MVASSWTAPPARIALAISGYFGSTFDMSVAAVDCETFGVGAASVGVELEMGTAICGAGAATGAGAGGTSCRGELEGVTAARSTACGEGLAACCCGCCWTGAGFCCAGADWVCAAAPFAGCVAGWFAGWFEDCVAGGVEVVVVGCVVDCPVAGAVGLLAGADCCAVCVVGAADLPDN